MNTAKKVQGALHGAGLPGFGDVLKFLLCADKIPRHEAGLSEDQVVGAEFVKSYGGRVHLAELAPELAPEIVHHPRVEGDVRDTWADPAHIHAELGYRAAVPFAEGLRRVQQVVELARVVRPGGRIALLDVGVPRNRVIRFGNDIYFGKVVPKIGALLSDGAAYRYLPKSVAYLHTPDDIVTALAEAGFPDVTVVDAAVPDLLPTPDTNLCLTWQPKPELFDPCTIVAPGGALQRVVADAGRGVQRAADVGIGDGRPRSAFLLPR